MEAYKNVTLRLHQRSRVFGIIDADGVSKGDDRTKHYSNVTKTHLIKRAGTADEVALGIIFAVENDFISGTTIDVDGGWLTAI